MSEQLARPGITIFTGRFGSGKTEAAIGYAVQMARRLASGVAEVNCPSEAQPAAKVALIDLDVVTPYFRSREAASLLEKKGVQVISPSPVGQQLDTPALTPAILGAIQQPAYLTVIDVGGDRQGARVLGVYGAAIVERGYVMLFVVNPYRPFTNTLSGLRDSIAEIEASSRLRVTSLVSNPNLIDETTAEHIVDGHSQIEEFAAQLGLPIAWVCLERRWIGHFRSNHFRQPVLVLDRFLVQPWE